MRLNTMQYDALEAAVRDERRVVVVRRGTEFIIVPARLRQVKGRDAIEAMHPTTGDTMQFILDDLDTLEVVG